ncbi:MAG TPA: UDP-N-acetylmuramate dehydrogenase [Geopsychrobacteraceae bacterium]|nr:UDP-N-acetylmuramate dehydrogenase [Geopsychrobacteraceae bacterium]
MERLLSAIHEEFRGEILPDELMISHTSWRIGGPAELFLLPEDSSDLIVLLQVLNRYNAPWVVIGNGTNLLVKDGGIAGAVISLARFDAIDIDVEGLVRVEAGTSLPRLIRQTVSQGLQGLEGLAGIPGSVGGAVLMNAGAGDSEIGSRVETVTLVGPQGERILTRKEAGFCYRASNLSEKGIITSTTLRLQPSDINSLQKACTEKLSWRRHVQAVVGSHAGSVFKNPPGAKAWELIDAAGLRGERRGDAVISPVHCNHIVNLDQATAQDVLELVALTRQRVKEQSGIDLELEVHIVGREVMS